MTERAIFIENNASNSQSGPYSMGVMDNMVRAMMNWPDASAGVIRGADNELVASVQGGAVRIASGYAHVHGMIYWNDANVDLTPTTPVVGTTKKRIVVRKLWDDPVSGSISVKLAIVEGTDGSTATPALTQTDGTQWEIPVCTFEVSTAGVISALRDDRLFVLGGADPASVRAVRDTHSFMESEMIGDDDNTFSAIESGAGTGSLYNGTSSIVAASSISLGTHATNTGYGVYAFDFTNTAATGYAVIRGGTGSSATLFPQQNPHFYAIAMFASPPTGASEISVMGLGFHESANPTTHLSSAYECAFFRGGPTTNLFAVVGDGSTLSTIDLGSGYRDSTWHVFEVYTTDYGLTWTFAIDGSVVATHTTNVPTGSTGLIPQGGVYKSTSTAVRINNFFDIDYISVSTER